MSYLAGQQMTGVTRVRKLAAIRKFFTFLEENQIIAGNFATTVKGARREEKEPGILYKEQYKALLYEASENVRDYAIIMTFLQTGIRLSELVNLRVDDVEVWQRFTVMCCRA
jgi:site-specific recombinase XerD